MKSTRSLKVRKWKIAVLLVVLLLGIAGRPERVQAQNYSAAYGGYGGYSGAWYEQVYSFGSDCVCDALSYVPSFGSCNRVEIDD